jgi:nucleotide-binding universal stress UspA family protein
MIRQHRTGVTVNADAGGPIVAGVDGSAPSTNAARWAADEAHLRHAALELVLAYQIPVVGYPEYEYPPEFAESIRAARRNILEAAAGDVVARYPDMDVSTTLKESDARSALVDESKIAELTVVGSRGKGRLAEVLLGSTALHVAAHGHSPIVVVPSAEPATVGPILVGADGSAHTDAALDFAFEEAAVRGAELVAVLAWDELSHQAFARRPAIGGTRDEDADALLARRLAARAEKFPAVPVRRVVHHGSAADGLLRNRDAAGRPPQLIVVGSRGRGALSGLILGSTSQTLIIHAACPVVVVRPETNPPDISA